MEASTVIGLAMYIKIINKKSPYGRFFVRIDQWKT
jgi:hypothetical protein